MARIFWLETKFEFLGLWRMPSYSLTTILFPVLFYVFFGLVMGGAVGRSQGTMAHYLLGTYGASGVMAATLFALSNGVAAERGQGWLAVKRASPMPLAAWFFAKGMAATAFAGVVLVLLFGLGVGLAGVRLPAGNWLAGAGVLLAGALPCGLLGLLIGLVAKPNAAPGVANLVFMPMCFLSGLWIPIVYLPPVAKSIADYLPGYHLGQLGLLALGVPVVGDWGQHGAVLAGYTLVLAGLAWLIYRRQEERE